VERNNVSAEIKAENKLKLNRLKNYFTVFIYKFNESSFIKFAELII